MGQIADDMISGDSCSWCGVYFVKSHNYPVVCRDCWENSTPKQRKDSGVQLAIHKEL